MIDLNSYFRLIQSKSNVLIKEIHTHQEGGRTAAKLRNESSKSLIEGIHLLESWMTHQPEAIQTIVTSPIYLQNIEISTLIAKFIEQRISNDLEMPDLIVVEEEIAKGLTQMPQSPFLLAIIDVPEALSGVSTSLDIVILDGIQDAGNVGNILRTSAAAGITQVLVLSGTASIWSTKVLRAGMGAHPVLKFIECDDPVSYLSHLDMHILSTKLENATSLYEISSTLIQPVAWVFGNEGAGVSEWVSNLSRGVYIPQETQVESLNVASAAAICLFEMRRIRMR